MKIIFDPVFMTGNKYVSIIVAHLKKRQIEAFSIGESFRKPSLFFKIKIVHVNWFESLIGNNIFSITLYLFRQLFKLVMFKITKKKIVWTMHNKKPHEEGFQKLKQFLFNMMVSHADIIVVHNKFSIEWLTTNYTISRQKIVYIPHPHYISVYGDSIECGDVNIDQKEVQFLFFGAIKPYKNLELLIETFKGIENGVLTIIGQPVTEHYAKKIEALVGDSNNIKLRYQFVKDEEINTLLAQYDLLILPYSIKSTLNSGSVILAFSYKKTIVSPKIGTILDFGENEYILSYSYEDEAEHKEKLRQAIQLGIKKKHEQADFFKIAGQNLSAEVEIRNSPVLVAERLANVYMSLLKPNI